MTTPNKDDMLRKVRGLLAKAEAEADLGHEAAAEAYSAKAAELMAKYGIDSKLAEARANVKATPSSRVFDITAPYAKTKGHLLHAVARALHCQAITLQQRGADEKVHVFGFESDIELIDMLFTSLSLQMASAVSKMDIRPWLRGREVMAERRSFMLGFTAGVRPRLEEAYKLAVADADDSGTTGKELVLASRDLAVKTAYDEAYPHRQMQRTSSTGRSGGAGIRAGQRANIHDRGEVGNRQVALR